MNKKSKIIISFAGGLGNQLFQYSMAQHLTKKYKVCLEFDLGLAVKDAQGNPEILNFEIDKNFEIIRAKSVNKYSIRLMSTFRKISSTNKKVKKYSVQMLLELPARLLMWIEFGHPLKVQTGSGTGYFNPKELFMRNSYLVGYFQSYRWSEDKSDLGSLRKIKLKDYSTEISRYQSLSELEDPLVVHIRLGDYIDNPKFGIPSEKYYLRGLEKLWESKKYKKIWIFTNDQSSAEKIFPSEFLEYARWIPEVEGSASKTLEVMRFGKGYLIGNSTFSWWGARLSYAMNPAVIVPNPWFAEADVPIDLIPSDWEELSAGYPYA